MLTIERDLQSLQEEFAKKDSELDEKEKEYKASLSKAPQRRDELHKRFQEVWVLAFAGESEKLEDLEQLRQELRVITQFLEESRLIDVPKIFQHARNVCWRPLRRAISEKEGILRRYLNARKKLENLAPNEKFDDAELLAAAEACGPDAVAEAKEIIERKKSCLRRIVKWKRTKNS